MGPGHLGVGFAAKSVAPKAPLWSLLVASEAIDLLCFVFVGVGIEKMAVWDSDISQGMSVITPGSTPWPHGLFMSVVWSILFGVIAYLFSKERRTSIVIGLVIFSHWILDFITHPPDLPLLFEGSPNLGLGLWSSGPGLIISGILEFVILGAGIAIYIIWRRRKKQEAQI